MASRFISHFALLAILLLSACSSDSASNDRAWEIMGMGLMGASQSYYSAPVPRSIVCHRTSLGMNCY